MMDEDEITLEEALDFLQKAEWYCFDNELHDLGHDIADIYQEVSRKAPREDWEE